MLRRSTATLVALLLVSRALVGCAQESDLSLVGALDALNEGRYVDARGILARHLTLADTSGRAVVGFLETFRATGEYEQGLAEADHLLSSEESPAAFVHYMRARLLAAVGRNGEAELAHREAARLRRNYWRNAIELSTLLLQTGKAREAFQINSAIFSAYKQGYFRTSPQLAIAGRAAAFVHEFHDANAAYRTASQVDPRNVENLYWWGELFREKYNDADAQATFEEAIQINGNADWLRVALARSGAGFAQREALAEQALKSNGRSIGAMSVLASLRLLDGDDAEAERLAREALDVNPNSLDALAQLASVQLVRSDTAAYRQTKERALAVNPAASGFFVDIAENLSLRFRYPDAINVSREAVRVSPGNTAALAAHGTSLMRAGRFEEARRYLESAFERDEFNVFAGNTLTLLDEYEDFATLESDHFRLLIHGDEADVLGARMLSEAEAAYADMSPRYRYAPTGKILVEAYNDKDDFAVRIAGLPHLGLLGVSFGDVVALNTPRALANDPYNWARTLRHELSHTMAIGASGNRVPRWFTEGLSVYEEKRFRPDWGRDMEFDLYAAMDRDKLHDLTNMDRGFTRPEFPGQVMLSYFHASRIIEYLVESYGFESIVETLNQLRAGARVDAALSTATGVSVAVLDQDISSALNAERTRIAERLEGLPDVLAPDNQSGAVGLETTPGRAEANRLSEALRDGHRLAERGELDAAEKRFSDALDLYSGYVGPGNAYLALADIYRGRSDRNRLQDVLRQYLSIADYGVAQARELAALLESDGRVAEAIGYLERSIEVDPYDRETRSQLASHYLASGRTADAVGERRAILALNPIDRADGFFQLASALYRNGDIARAKRATLQALEIAPGHRDAQKLLLACVEIL